MAEDPRKVKPDPHPKKDAQRRCQRTYAEVASPTTVVDLKQLHLKYPSDITDTLDLTLPPKYPVPAQDQYDDVPTYPERPHFESKARVSHPGTLLVSFDGCPNDPYHPASMPIYQTATFIQPSVSEYGPYDYTRSGNPTRTALETLVARLEGAYAAFAFSSGMSALAALCRLLQSGDEVIACADLYGGMHRLLTQVCNRQGLTVKFVDTTNLSLLSERISHKTALVHIESPSNPLMRITDIRAVSKLCEKYGAIMSVDSTMMSPILQRPLDLGADIVMHSATKFLNGHSDVMGGFLCSKSKDVAKRIAFLQNAEGTALGPFDSWLMLRGIKTLVLRVEKAQYNAQRVFEFLHNHPRVTKLHYPGGCPPPNKTSNLSSTKASYDLHMMQCKGGGSVLSFETGDVRFSQRIVDACLLFKITVSFGSVSSLIEMPCTLSHASIPSEKRTLPDDLIRLSIGIEDWEDIVEDLQRAFTLAASDKDIKKVYSHLCFAENQEAENETEPSPVGSPNSSSPNSL